MFTIICLKMNMSVYKDYCCYIQNQAVSYLALGASEKFVGRCQAKVNVAVCE